MANVKISNLNKKYPNGFHAVKDVNLEIIDKEFMILVGPSGCGKTTTLRMIAGLEEITSGEMQIGDQIVNDVSPKDRNIAMVFQNYALYPHMTVYDNMAFGLKLKKTPKAEIDERITKAARILDIEVLLKRKPKQLSGGQRQRVALGRAIVRKPEVFLMDEPLSNLDAKLRVQMRAELIKLHNDLKTTFIYVTHDQTEAMTMGTRICVMNNGLVQQVADPRTIYNSPANLFVAGFIGAPQMNFFPGRIVDGKFVEVEDHTFKLSEKMMKAVKEKGKESAEVTVGIRPEDIKISNSQEGISAKVEVTELLGSDLNVYFKIGQRSYILKTEAASGIKLGDDIYTVFDSEKLHLFDLETEESLVY
ncbi:sn-glycerol-3-phosphate ABC transporter ATP-binding protein UgpC [Fusibacter bizertensis]|uniref:Sn-glycerol-3-phosphate ABC transporter ATP-binding protein UgpC n=1 Tax=Fusibacter bizertensis TaxID=1488331 RepID=A0ABT6NAL8_9FIRM|nr:sn-glycerol-3-phosphate ABC transporter ATP-binding protein UgpC [Fusibacter bizertensis]MDH8677440.1 sn-glycerol-3-phosphate ABC transporter ATP-binding protein UgpC [Fusibacter bizertensis]